MSPTELMRTLTRVRQERDALLAPCRALLSARAMTKLHRSSAWKELTQAMDAEREAIVAIGEAVAKIQGEV